MLLTGKLPYVCKLVSTYLLMGCQITFLMSDNKIP